MGCECQMWMNATFRSGLFELSELAVVTFAHSTLFSSVVVGCQLADVDQSLNTYCGQHMDYIFRFHSNYWTIYFFLSNILI